MSESDNDDYLFDPGATPDASIVALERALAPLRKMDLSPRAYSNARQPVEQRSTAFRWWLAAAAALVLLLGTAEVYSSLVKPWAVVDVNSLASTTTVRAGDAIVTGPRTTKRLNVGSIGRAEIRPGSRVRVVKTATTEYRLALDEGEIHARIWAPPRFFLVETPNALAVDLGCVYTLRAMPDGSGVLRVEQGEVELVAHGRTVRVAAGSAIHMEVNGDLGVPYQWGPAVPAPVWKRAWRGVWHMIGG